MGTDLLGTLTNEHKTALKWAKALKKTFFGQRAKKASASGKALRRT